MNLPSDLLLDRRLLRLAQQEANQFFGIATDSRPTASRTKIKTGGLLAVIAIVAAVVSVWRIESSPTSAPPLRHDPIPAAHPATLFEVGAPPLPLPSSTMRPQPVRNTAMTQGGIRRVGDELSIDVTAIPLGQAVQSLARLTQASLDMPLGLPALARPVSVTWRGRSAAAAWNALLDSHASFAARCDDRHCQVWLAGEAVAGVAAMPASAVAYGAAAVRHDASENAEDLDVEAFGRPQ